jgi:hypothetical protein
MKLMLATVAATQLASAAVSVHAGFEAGRHVDLDTPGTPARHHNFAPQ